MSRNILLSILIIFLFSIVKADKNVKESQKDSSAVNEEEVVTTNTLQPDLKNGVFVLTEDNFDKFVKGTELMLVKFYTQNCQDCEEFTQTYEKIAQMLQGKVDVAMVDATANVRLVERYEVKNYPTVKILKNGKLINYNGTLSEGEILKKVETLLDYKRQQPTTAVINLTQENFDNIVNDTDIILVEFYSPWCGHCKKLAPEYESAAKILRKRDPAVALAKVDATSELILANRFNITRYPTLKLFRRGQVYKYEGRHDKNGILNFMYKEMKPPSKLIVAAKTIGNFLHGIWDIAIIGCFTGKNSDALEIFLNAGISLRSQYTFHHTFEHDVMQILGCTVGQVVLFQPQRFHSKYENASFTLNINSTTTKVDLEKFYDAHAIPLVGERDPNSFKKRYSMRPLVVIYYTVDFSHDHKKSTQLWRNKIVEVANKIREVTFAISNEEDFEEELQSVGLDDSPEEINVIAFDQKGKKYVMPPNDHFDEDVLSEFVQDFFAGNLKPKLKTARKPKNNKGLVKIVVGSTFDEMVMNDNINVLLALYSSLYCDRCKELEPTYKKLGKKYQKNKSVIIAKMDVDTNEAPHETYRPYVEQKPVLLLAKAGSKDTPVMYDGGEKLDDLVKFVKEQTKPTSARDEL